MHIPCDCERCYLYLPQPVAVCLQGLLPGKDLSALAKVVSDVALHTLGSLLEG